MRPDRVQDPSGQLVTVLGCAEFDDLRRCLEELEVTGVSRFVRESESGPISACFPCTPAGVVDHVRTGRPLTITLLAEDASVDDMRQRIDRLVARSEGGIRVLPAAS